MSIENFLLNSSVSSGYRPREFDFRKAGVGEMIAPLSFDPNEASKLELVDVVEGRQKLSKNLEGFKGEVLSDDPVSHRFDLYYDANGDVYDHPDRKPVNKFDAQFHPLEREGLPLVGFKKATKLLRENPGSTVFLYSPPGLATPDLDPANPFSRYPFIYGQLYVMNFDGEKINEVAVKVDREGEPLLEQFMPHQFYEAGKLKDDYDRIRFFVQNPVILSGKIDDLALLNWKDGRLYGGKTSENRSITVHQMFEEVREKFSKEWDVSNAEIEALVRNLRPEQLADKQVIAQLYLGLVAADPKMLRDGKVSLLGACGGSIKTKNEIYALLGRESEDINMFVGRGMVESFGSAYRVMTQGNLFNQALAGDAETETHHASYRCQKCNKKMSGEARNGKNWRSACDGCGVPLGC